MVTIKVPIKDTDSDLEVQLKVKQAIEDYGNEMGFKEGQETKLKIKAFKKHIRITVL